MDKCKECKMTFEKLYDAITNINLTDCGSCKWKFYLSNPFSIALANNSSDKEKVLNLYFNNYKRKEKKI